MRHYKYTQIHIKSHGNEATTYGSQSLNQLLADQK